MNEDYLQLQKELLDKKQQYFSVSMNLVIIGVVLLLLNLYYLTHQALPFPLPSLWTH